MAGLRVTTVNPQVEYSWNHVTRQRRDQVVAELRDTVASSPWATVKLPHGTTVSIKREHIVSIEEWS